MDYQIREMKPEEAKAVQSLGRRTFMGLESFFVPKPKKALLAVSKNKIVGAVMYKLFTTSRHKIGYIDFIFVKSSMHGTGIGRHLLDKATALLWKHECDYISAEIKDDNAGSWGLFIKQGYTRLSFYQMVKELGIESAFRQYFGTFLCMSVGYEYYVARKGMNISMTKDNTPVQMAGYLAMNTLVFTVMALIQGFNPRLFLPVSMAVWAGIMLFGFLGTLFSREDWHFRTTDGGFIVHFLVSFSGGIFPFVGNWYPRTYRKDADFKRSLGLSALFQWGYLILLAALPIFGLPLPPALIMATGVAIPLSIAFAIPFYPAESLSAGRVFRWNKAIYLIMLALTIGVLCL